MLCLIAYRFIRLNSTCNNPFNTCGAIIFGSNFFCWCSLEEKTKWTTLKGGVGIYLTWKHGQHTTHVFVAAKTPPVSNPIQAEAEGLLLAANITSSLLLQEPFFFTDNLNLAKAIQEKGGTNSNVLWEIRRQAVQFRETLSLLHPKMMHINRTLNVIVHNFATG